MTSFGRTVNQIGIVLVDWEGQVANPAMKYYLKAAEDASYPVRVTLTSSEPRLYFNLPSATGPNGPNKLISIQDSSSQEPFYISIFPDLDTAVERHTLNVKYVDARGVGETVVIDVHVIDQDIDRPLDFHIHVDTSQDQIGLLDDPEILKTVRQAALDWAYFLGDMGLDEVTAGDEKTWIWNSDGFRDGKIVTNRESYTGFLLYVYSIQHDLLKSGGESSWYGGYQSSGRNPYSIRRSGGVSLEKRGNYNTLGWIVQANERDWWRATNLSDEPNDLYSIAHHEMGHALAFHGAYDLWAEFKAGGSLTDTAVAEYHGSAPMIDSNDHMPGTKDRASRRGRFRKRIPR